MRVCIAAPGEVKIVAMADVLNQEGKCFVIGESIGNEHLLMFMELVDFQATGSAYFGMSMRFLSPELPVQAGIDGVLFNTDAEIAALPSRLDKFFFTKMGIMRWHFTRALRLHISQTLAIDVNGA